MYALGILHRALRSSKSCRNLLNSVYYYLYAYSHAVSRHQMKVVNEIFLLLISRNPREHGSLGITYSDQLSSVSLVDHLCGYRLRCLVA